jgi:hypothetical protein
MKKFLFLLLFGLLIPNITFAAIVPACATSGEGGICCAVVGISNVARFIVGITGSLALLFFIFGGFNWITSAGNSSKVDSGRKMMTGAVIGIFITLFAWVAVNFILVSLAGQKANSTYTITGLNQSWYNICSSTNYDPCAAKGANYQCQHFSGCGLNSWEECSDAQNCERLLCPKEKNEIVCCNPNITPFPNQ